MSAFVTCSYTPPPPTKPSESSRSMLEAIDHPIAATPLPPSSIAQTQRPRSSSSGKTLASSSTTPSQQQQQEQQQHLQQHQPPQIRYCYFISASAASASTSISRNPSLSRKAIYLTPHVQDPMDASPNCTQPRSRPSREPASSAFVLGPNPPQIQLQFLEDEPLPPPSSTTEPIHSTETVTQQKQPSDAVLVERKDSGYGGSVSRSSSLAAFGRGIRKVFWRTSSKGSVESIVVTEPPVLDCDIPQDVLDLDHEGWAQDLAQRLTLASGPDIIADWLGQLPADVALLAEGTSTDEMPSEGTLNVLSLPEGSVSAESLQEMIEEFIFMAPRPVETTAAPTPTIALYDDFNVQTIIPPSAPSTPSPSHSPVEKAAEKTLRPVLSIEQLNKPQPPLPAITFENKPVPATPVQAGRTSGGSSPLSTLARKFTLATDFGRGKTTSGRRSTLSPTQRNSVQQHFQHAASEVTLSQPTRTSRDRRLSGNNMETLLDERLISPSSLVMSPDEEEVEGDSYVTAKFNAKKSNRFFKSLTTSSVAELKKRQNEVRPLSEVLLSDSNLSPEEISAEIVTASRSSSLRSPAMRKPIPKWDETSSQDSVLATQEDKRQSGSFSLAPPMPLFYKSTASSASSLGETSSCGSVESSADEWEGPSQMTKHALEQNARYNADLKGLQDLLYQGGPHPQFTPAHSNNTSTGSLVLSTVPSSPSRRDTKPAKGVSKKDDYMSHRMSGCSPKLLPVPDKKSRPKSRLSMTYGGGELETVKPAKFDTPEAIARNKEIRKFISQEIYTTELNYLQYLRSIQEVFVDPLFRSLESDKPFIPRANPLYQLLAHISTLTAVASQIAQSLEDCVRDEVWSDELSMIGTIFLDIKEPLSIFLKYGQSYGKGMKALRTLMKSKRASISIATASTPSTANNTPASTLSSGSNTLTVPGGPRLDKRRSLPSIFALNGPSPHQSHVGSSWSTVSNCSTNSSAPASSSKSKSGAKPRSSHGMMTTGSSRDSLEFETFLRNCAGGKETTSRFSLADLMILPIQRVTRYCLLLKDLKRHTAVDHPDYICLVHALEQLHTLALATNNVQPSSLRL
ncbi:Rho guanine nucleotide exchange factor (GEF) 17 [Linnemannia zychae]|nr:Rho guanine nucleotide exchange factor (GEF) 17 [Linnemannia zychae]